MNGREKSDSAEVAVKPTNKAGMLAEEQVEPRAGTKGNATRKARPGHRAGPTRTQARDRIRVAARRTKDPPSVAA